MFRNLLSYLFAKFLFYRPAEFLFHPVSYTHLDVYKRQVLVGAVTLAAYMLGEYVLSDPDTADGVACTMSFATLVFCELNRAFAVRSEHHSIFKIGIFLSLIHI